MVFEEIHGFFEGHGDDAYFGEKVSQKEHALQCAQLAVNEGASDALVVAALVHDIGHLLHDEGEDAADRGIDTKHEDDGYAYLKSRFPQEVCEPVRLHVEAKRYLCAVEPEYMSQLSEASQLSLRLQGGVMSPEEVERFRANPYAQDAVRLRHWDDAAKIHGLEVLGLEAYADRIEKCALV